MPIRRPGTSVLLSLFLALFATHACAAAFLVGFSGDVQKSTNAGTTWTAAAR